MSANIDVIMGNRSPTEVLKAYEQLLAALDIAIGFIESAPHGDNCFVSSHYEGDPGNQCNCGKDGVLNAIEAARPDSIQADLSDSALEAIALWQATKDAP